MLRKAKTVQPEEAVRNNIEQLNEKVADEVTRRKRVTRTFPASPFEEPLAFASQVYEFGSGEQVRRLTLFNHIGKAPDSGSSRQVITNSNKSSHNEFQQVWPD